MLSAAVGQYVEILHFISDMLELTGLNGENTQFCMKRHLR